METQIRANLRVRSGEDWSVYECSCLRRAATSPKKNRRVDSTSWRRAARSAATERPSRAPRWSHLVSVQKDEPSTSVALSRRCARRRTQRSEPIVVLGTCPVPARRGVASKNSTYFFGFLAYHRHRRRRIRTTPDRHTVHSRRAWAARRRTRGTPPCACESTPRGNSLDPLARARRRQGCLLNPTHVAPRHHGRRIPRSERYDDTDQRRWSGGFLPSR